MRKSSILRRICSLAAAIFIAIACAVPARALESVFTPSASYASGEYSAALRDLSLTGDPRADIAAVALSQVGYHEGSSTDDLSGGSTASGNYTEYGRCFGTASDEWCAMFLWWCASQAGISENVIPRTEWAKRLTYGCPAYPVSQITAQRGDLVFIDNNGDFLEDHVGLVIDIRDGRTITVEGNVSNRVVTRSYTQSGKCSGSSGVILYIGRPDYDHDGASHGETENYIEITSDTASATQSLTGPAGSYTAHRGERYLLLNIVQRDGIDWYMFAVGLHAFWISGNDARCVEKPAPTTTTTASTVTTTASTTVSTTAPTTASAAAPDDAFEQMTESGWEVSVSDQLPPAILADDAMDEPAAQSDYTWEFALVIAAIVAVFAALLYFTLKR